MEILTERLRLRDFKREDIVAHHLYQNDPRYLEHYPDSEISLERSQNLIEQFISWSKAQPRIKFQLATTDLHTDIFMGNCGIRCEAPGDRQAEIGYEFDPKFWGKGFATEAATSG